MGTYKRKHLSPSLLFLFLFLTFLAVGLLDLLVICPTADT
jgi:hypothetical protein